jgi:hypothetical protein
LAVLSRRGVWLQVAVVTVLSIATYYYVLGGGADSPPQVSTPLPAGTNSTSTQSQTSPARSQTSQTQASSTTVIGQTITGASVAVVTDQLNLDHQQSMSVAYWQVVVENSGSVPVLSLAMSLSAPFAGSMCTNTSGMLVAGFGTGTCAAATMASPLQPGETISGGATLDITDTGGMPAQGSMYTMTLTASFADGSTTTNSFYMSAQVMM